MKLILNMSWWYEICFYIYKEKDNVWVKLYKQCKDDSGYATYTRLTGKHNYLKIL